MKGKGIHRAISTANDIERAEKYLKKIGLYGYFDKIICAPMVEHGKPAPDVYEFACSELKLAPEECMAVEDSPNGVKSAYSAGCKVVMVPDLTQPDEELKKMLFASTTYICCDYTILLISSILSTQAKSIFFSSSSGCVKSGT